MDSVAASTGQRSRQVDDLDDPKNPLYAQRHGGSLVTGLLDSLSNFAGTAKGSYEGSVDPISDESISRALDFAMNMSGQAPLTARSGAAGIFGGRLSKTAPHKDMDAVESILANPRNKIDEETLWKEFGAMQGAEGKMRYEIDDSKAGFKKRTAKDFLAMSDEEFKSLRNPTVGSELNHPELFEAYPHTKDIKLTQNETGGGYYDRISNEINIPNPSRDNHEALSVLLHELQHAVQAKEGFIGGENLDRIKSMIYDLGGMRPELENAFLNLDVMDRNIIRHNLYKRNAGETEARLVQSRMNDSSDVRRWEHPYSDLDIPKEKIIIPFRDINE